MRELRAAHSTGTAIGPTVLETSRTGLRRRNRHHWSRRCPRTLDFQFDETTDERRLKSLDVVDEHTRKALAIGVGRNLHQ